MTKAYKNVPSGLRHLHSGVGLFEAPVWARANTLYFSNVTLGGVLRLNVVTGGITPVVLHRRGIGGLALSKHGEFVVSGREISLKKTLSAETVTLANPGAEVPTMRGFNDLTVDPQGRVIAGALGIGALSPDRVGEVLPPPPEGMGTASVWRISDGGYTQIADDIGHTNGIAYSADGNTAYLSDTLRRVVYSYRVSEAGWSDRSEFIRLANGGPDGMAVAEDGTLWLATAADQSVLVFDSSGRQMKRFDIPGHLTTSVCFGGDELRTVFVTTGSHGSDGPAEVLSFGVDVAGVPVPLAQLAPFDSR